MGNLPPDITEEEMRKLFEKYGKAGEVFIHKDKGFGFIRLVSELLPLGCFCGNDSHWRSVANWKQ